jgi:hypothetical protein
MRIFLMRAPLVTVVWRLGLILCGFAAATLVAALSYAPHANAQAASTQQPPPTVADDLATAYETRPKRQRPSDVEPDGETSDAAASDSFADQDASPSPESDDIDRDAATLSDGAATSDGLIDLAEPAASEDGADPTVDTRPSEDTAVFENPPAGYDPLLFQIEDVDPVQSDRRPARLARFEPYDPIGIRIGSFVFFPETEIAGVWTDNVLSSPNARSDIAAEILTTSRLVSNWSRHAIELRGTSLTSFHDDFPSEDDRAWGLEARGRLDITRRTNIQARASHNLSQESRSAIDANQVGERADVTTELAQLALNHRFNRLSVQLRGSVSDTTYSDTDGLNNADRDTLETKQAVRASWQFKPTFATFAEQELNQRDKQDPPSDGIPRDSTGTRTRVGLDFGATGAILRGEVSVGYGRQTPDDSRLSAVDAFLFDANLAWRPSEITSFLLTAQSDIYDTTTANSGGVASHSIGLEARHALRRYVIASAGIVYTNYDYAKSPIEESALTSFVGGEYYASPQLVLFTRYEHLSYASNQVNADYESDEIRLGVRIRK